MNGSIADKFCLYSTKCKPTNEIDSKNKVKGSKKQINEMIESGNDM